MAVGLTQKGNGTKLMLVADGEGRPIELLDESAQTSTIWLVEEALRSVGGWPESAPH